ncbi:MAG: CoA-binding protein [Desulfobacterales bacterium]
MAAGIVEQLDPIFKPKSVAFIGASNNPAKWGGRLISSTLQSGFRGSVFPVNPKEKHICGLTAYADILDIPDEVDLAVFTVPAAHMPEIMHNCVKKGIKGGIIISADFAETGQKGRALEMETVTIARKGGIRFVGPNGNGIFSPAGNLNITPFPNPPRGGLAFVSQSGMFGGQAVRLSVTKGFGLSTFVAMGNQADLTAADYLSYLAVDPDTKAIALYIEGLKDGRTFWKTARETTRIKPVLILKGGTSEMGAKATLSHTASIAGEDRIFDGMCRQAGLIRVRQLEHLFIMAEALIDQPLPKGNRIAVVGNGGQGVTITDNLSAAGIQIPEFEDADKQGLKDLLPPHAPVPNNPVDFAAGIYETMDEVRVVEKLAAIDYIDGIITNVPMDRTLKNDTPAQAKIAVMSAIDRFCRIPRTYQKPVITQKLNSSASTMELLKSAKIPMYNTSEQCTLAMAALIQYADMKPKKR